MTREHFSITDRNGKACDVYLWKSDLPKPRGILQISHGMAEHILRYERMAEFMCGSGYWVIGSDHPGHGIQTNEEDLGYFGDQGHTGAVDRLADVSMEVKERFGPNVPLFLLGHSMGSFMARSYITKYGDMIDGVVIMGTSGPNPMSGIGIALINIMSVFKGETGKSKLVDNMMFGGYNKGFGEKSKFSWLSSDEGEVGKYEDDTRCGFLFTLNGQKTVMKVLSEVSTPKWAKKVPKKLPILLMSGQDDPVGQKGRGVKKVFDMLSDAGVEDIDMILYPGGRHEILNDIDRDKVMRDILLFLEKNTKE